MPRMEWPANAGDTSRQTGHPDTPIILLTALGSDMDIIGDQSGRHDVLTKPAEDLKVVSLISAILGRRRALEGEAREPPSGRFKEIGTP